MIRRLGSLLLLGFIAAACSSDDKPALEDRPEPLIVYASYDNTEYLPEFFRAFTDETGIYVTVRHQSAAANAANMIDGRNQRPADVFIAASAADALRVSENSGLLPLGRESYEGNVPDSMRDADGYWAAWSLSTPNVVFAAGEADVAPETVLQVLGRRDFEGAVCMSSSKNASNQALIAHLLRSFGGREAEVLVQNWMRNLALAPFDTDLEVLEAIDAGVCRAGLVFSQAVNDHQLANTNDAKQYVQSVPVFAHAEALGVARHAKQPELAQQLVAWMLSPARQQQHAEATGRLPAIAGENWESIGAAAWRAEEAQSLISLASYR